jgi:hypothetical protein
MDMTGRILSTVERSRLSAGDHNVEVSTANLASGNYVYLIRTSDGDGLGVQFTVSK